MTAKSARPTAGSGTTISADTADACRGAATRPAPPARAGERRQVGPARRGPGRPDDGVGHTDAAAPLDLLLTDGARGPLRRLRARRARAALGCRPRRPPDNGRPTRCGTCPASWGRSRSADPRARPENGIAASATTPGAPTRCCGGSCRPTWPPAAPSAALLADAHLDWRDRTRLEFALDNLVAALAPSNNPLISPTAWKALIDSGGANVVKGVRNLVTDLAAAPRVPTMVRPDAFEVGVDLAVTPGAVVLRTETFELIQYTPQTPTVRTRPLLIVPPVINKYYLADLAPGRSLVEYLVQGGQQVFMISWRNPDARHRDWGIDVYGQAILDALDAALAVTGADAATVLGFCSGGTLQSMALAALQQRGQLDDKVAGFALAVCVLDQAQAGVAGALLDETTAKAATAASAARGYLDGRTLAELFAWLRPNDLIWNYWVNNYLQGKDPAPFDILFWNADTTRMTAALHREFLDLALRNALVGARGGEHARRSRWTCRRSPSTATSSPVSPTTSPRGRPATAARSCSAATPASCCPPAGTSPRSSTRPPTRGRPTRSPPTSAPSHDAWQHATAMTTGSWWPDYLAWLSQRSGPDRDAPQRAGRSRAGAAGRRARRLRPRPMNADPARAVRLVSVGGQLLRIHVRPGDPRRTPLLLVNGIGAGLDPSTPLRRRARPATAR